MNAEDGYVTYIGGKSTKIKYDPKVSCILSLYNVPPLTDDYQVTFEGY